MRLRGCDRDYVRKRAQYAAVGIPEYVIVDPETQTVTVLVLSARQLSGSGMLSGRSTSTLSNLPRSKSDCGSDFWRNPLSDRPLTCCLLICCQKL